MSQTSDRGRAHRRRPRRAGADARVRNHAVQAIRGPQAWLKGAGIEQHYFSTRQTWPMRTGCIAQPPGRSSACCWRANMVALIVFQMLRGGAGYDSLYGWVGNLAMLVPTAACFACAWRGGPRRAPAIWLGLAMLSQTAGNVIVSAWLQFQTDPPVPSPSDFAYFGFYVCVTAAIVCLVRRDHGSFPRALWLDGALGAAGAATALAAALSPVLSATQGDFATVLVGSTYTAADLLAGRADRRPARRPRPARRIDVAVDRRRARPLLRGRRRVRPAASTPAPTRWGPRCTSGGRPESRASPSRSGGRPGRARSRPAAPRRCWSCRCSPR